MAIYDMTDNATLQSVVNNCCTLLSLAKPQSAVASNDPNIQLLITSANLASFEMMNTYEWPELTKQGRFTVFTNSPPSSSEAVEIEFPLPEDFYRFIDQTQWNGSMRYPSVGPVSPQGWMTYMVFPISANFTLTWQMRGNSIWFLNPPQSPGQEFRFMYLSRALVQDGDNPELFKNVASKDSDRFVLDGILMTLLTRVKWLESKGFDNQAAFREFMIAFDTRVAARKGANILNMAAQRGGYPYIGVGNLPDSSLYGMRSN